jgi:AhpD family alkylhydroperoxidase
MKPRLNVYAVAPAVLKPMLAMEQAIKAHGLEHSLVELVKTRASILNHCAFCIDMHTRDARVAGESEQRLFLLSAWQEAPCYTERERAALAWTDALTLLAETGAPDSAYETMAAQFDPEEQVKLTHLIVTINAWNRFAVGFRNVPGQSVGA